jgi:GNAT superfamily N-acetyltransferase
MSLRTEILTGPAIARYIPALAALRQAVFRDWPYLYEGEDRQERGHLAAFASSASAALVVVLDGEQPVGCSTCLALADESASVRAPFERQGWDVERFCYFGESVLLRAYRGRGLGVAFFAMREDHARRLPGVAHTCFCGVRRAADDRRRPDDAMPLDDFWRKRGYQPMGVACEMRWPEIDGGGEVTHTLDFWGKPLTAAPLPRASA